MFRKKSIAQYLSSFLLFNAVTLSPTFSQTSNGDGVIGWVTPNPMYSSTAFPTPQEACKSQMDYYAWGSPTLEMGIPYQWGRWDQYRCEWSHPPGTVLKGSLPTNVWFECEAGYLPVEPGICILEDTPVERDPLNDVQCGDPIDIMTGRNIQRATDFVSQNGLLTVDRVYLDQRTSGHKTYWGGHFRNASSGWQFDLGPNAHISNFGNQDNEKVSISFADGVRRTFRFTSAVGFVMIDFGADNSTAANEFSLFFETPRPTNLSSAFDNSQNFILRDNKTGEKFEMEIRQSTFAVGPAETANHFALPVKKTDRQGRVVNYDWGIDTGLNSISDEFGQTISFQYKVADYYHPKNASSGNFIRANILIDSITLPDGTTLKYDYDPINIWGDFPGHFESGDAYMTTGYDNLTKVQHVYDPASTSVENVISETSYLYEDPIYRTKLSSIIDKDGKRFASWSYDASGRTTSSWIGNNKELVSVEYEKISLTGAKRIVTNPFGKKTEYNFTKGASDQWVLDEVIGIASATCVASNSDYAYDSTNKLTQITDEEGYITKYLFNNDGRVSQITEAFGLPEARTVSYTWNNDAQIKQRIGSNLKEDFFYNTLGQLVRYLQTDISSKTIPYSTNGQAREWQYTYTTKGNIASIDGPYDGTTDLISYTYSPNGVLQTITNELGHVTTISAVDTNGRPTEILDKNGVLTTIAYDSLGYIKQSIVDPVGAALETSYEHNFEGKITKITTADGQVYNYSYNDARWLMEINSNNGARITFDRNNAGEVSKVEVFTSDNSVVYQHSSTFDELGRLIKSVGASNQEWSLSYDKVSNLTSISDPRNNSTIFAYNGIRKLISETDAVNATTNLSYSEAGNISTVVDAKSVTTNFVYNGFGEIIQESSPDIGTTIYWRDQLGNITQREDSRGVIANYYYDGAGRLTAVNYPASSAEDVTLTYDSVTNGKGKVTEIQDAIGTTQYTYNTLGLVASETLNAQGTSLTTSYLYDDAGNLLHTIYPSGRIVSAWRDAKGELSSISTRANNNAPLQEVAFEIEWFPYSNRIKSLEFGNGLNIWNTLDQDYRHDQMGVYDGATKVIKRTFGHQDNLNITNIWDGVNAANDQSYWYSTRNMLQNGDGPWGDFEYYQDGTGNITWKNETVGGTTTGTQFNYLSGTNRLSSIYEAGTLARSFGYDANGSIVSDAKGTTTRTFTYNNANQLAAVSDNGNLGAQYQYNARNQLVIRNVVSGLFTGTIAYIYDLNDNIIAEYDVAAQTLRKEYIWLNDMPLAVVDYSTGTPELFYVHADHLNRPIAMSDGAKSLVAQWTWLPFGGVHQFSGSMDLDLRFPGQVLFAETGLHYNWHRHYDPSIGRYTQPDPLGLIDGPNRYAYVLNDPLQRVDPDGLQRVLARPFPSHGAPGGPNDEEFNQQLNEQMNNFRNGFINSCKLAFKLRFGIPIGPANPDCREEKRACTETCLDAQYDPDRQNVWGGSMAACLRGCLSVRCGGNSTD